MKKQRRKHTAEFKARVALEAIRGVETISEISAPETGRYRFCGYGDDIWVAWVNNRIVIDACHVKWKGRVTKWDGDDDNNRRFPISGQTMVLGDWFRLTKGKSVDIEVLFGECPGGGFACQLMIEQEGTEYRRVPFEDTTRPVLPVFKTVDIPDKLIPKMKLNPNVAMAEGPTFEH